jgi:hypothetical protein
LPASCFWVVAIRQLAIASQFESPLFTGSASQRLLSSLYAKDGN